MARRRLRKGRNALELAADIGGTVGLVAVVVAFGAGLASAVAGLAKESPLLVWSGVAFLAGVTVTSGIAVVIVAGRSSDTEDQLGYRWTSASYTYSIDPTDPHFHRQRVDVEICALRDGVRTFTNQYLWSGSGVDDLPEIVSPHSYLMGPVMRSGGWKHYAVSLDPPLRRGEVGTVSLLQRLIDSDERFDSFLAKTLHERLDRLTLRVELPATHWPDRAWRVHKRGRGAAAVEVDRTEVALGAPGAAIEWVVDKPSFMHSYEIVWKYDGGRSLYGTTAEGGAS